MKLVTYLFELTHGALLGHARVPPKRKYIKFYTRKTKLEKSRNY